MGENKKFPATRIRSVPIRFDPFHCSPAIRAPARPYGVQSLPIRSGSVLPIPSGRFQSAPRQSVPVLPFQSGRLFLLAAEFFDDIEYSPRVCCRTNCLIPLGQPL